MSDFPKIKLLVLDVDGTLTDGGIFYDSQGNETKRFNVKDGLGIKVAIEAGIKVAVITGRDSVMVERRVKELGIHHYYAGAQDKVQVLKLLLFELGIDAKECGYIGDDWNDISAMKFVGLRACPVDAAEEVKELCDYVSTCCGGYGAVRDCIEYWLKRSGIWEYCCERLY